MTTVYNKLVRDRIPDIIEADGETPITERVVDDAYHEALREKLDEEVAEYQETGDVEELADVLEVVYALGEQQGVDRSALEEKREQKRAERGGFDRGIVLKRVEAE